MKCDEEIIEIDKRFYIEVLIMIFMLRLISALNNVGDVPKFFGSVAAAVAT